MAIAAGTLPSQVPFEIAPFDANLAFGMSQVMTATGYVNSGAQLDVGPGRTSGVWALNVTAMSGTTPSFAFGLVGSNTLAFTAGDVQLIAYHDFAPAAAQRVFPAILGLTPTIPPTGIAGTLTVLPFDTLIERITFRYLRCYALIAGTTPSISFSTWISMDSNAR